MINRNKLLIIRQVDKKVAPFIHIQSAKIGWLENIRKAMGLSLKQLACRMGKTPQSVKQLQEREKAGSITLNSLNEAAGAMGMRVVYALVPKDGLSLEKYIRKRAEEVATIIVSRTNRNMLLEEQAVGKTRLKRSIKELSDELMQTPEKLWD